MISALLESDPKKPVAAPNLGCPYSAPALPDAVLGKESDRRQATFADYSNLKCTEQVFAESMRLYMPAWTMGRMSTKPVKLGEYLIPPEAHFFFSQYMMGRTPEYFPDPLKFDPDRFSTENKAKRPRYTYFPFGGGSRQCIGESFAWMEGVFSIATLAQSWRRHPPNSRPRSPSVPMAR